MTRLIDADALHKLFGAVTTDLLSKPELSKDFEHMVRAFIMTTEMIEDQPTIDAVPVKRGEWVEYPYCLCYEGALTEYDIACSSCGAVFNVIDNCTETFKYCPNCGARMDKDE